MNKYIIVSPVRNEENNIKKTIKSVISQTLTPSRWVIVDDGSSDGTVNIIEEYVAQNDWITLLKLKDRGYYDLAGGGEIKAFYAGLNTIDNMEYEYLAKLDGDISFDEHYFANLLNEFSKNEKLGIASGTCFSSNGKSLVVEKSYKYHVRGAARVYRRQCWEAIGGVIDKLGWDAVDVYKARMLGWDTCSFAEIHMNHHVKTWTKGGVLRGKVRQGRLCYVMGMHPLFFLAKAVVMIVSKPFLLGAFMMGCGYLKSSILQEERVVDKELMNYIRKDQLRRLFAI